MRAALYTEFIKVWKSKIFITTLIFFGFIGLMMGFIMLAAMNPEITANSEILSTKASLISTADWPSFFSLLLQLSAVLSVLGPGIVTAWVFGREYSDRTIKDILALPVSRLSIISAKFMIIALWSLLLLIVMFATAVIIGVLIRLEGWSAQDFMHYTRLYLTVSLLTITLVTPVALITSMSRGYLLPVGVLILILIVTQFMFVVMPGITSLFPWAIPALGSGIAGPLSPRPGLGGYLILAMTSIAGFSGTAAWWQYSDQH